MSTRAIAVAIAGGWSLFSVTATAEPQEPPAAHPASSESSGAPASPAAASTPAAAASVAAVPAASTSAASAPSVAVPDTSSAPLRTESPPAPMGGAPPAARSILPEWLNGVTLGAGVLLWYYQPIAPRAPGVENNVSVFWARLVVDGKWGIFSFHLEPRFRDSPLRTQSTTVNGASVLTYAQNAQAWLQEAYAQVDLDVVQAHLKVGKEYSHLGYFWDNSFYGNVQVYDGLKLDPDFGLSLEGDVGKSDDRFSLGWWAQYFVVDGTTNVSLPTRDTISVPGGRRRNQAIARIEPRVNLGGANVAIGVSGEYLQAALPAPIGPQNVWRGAVDATVTAGGLKVLGELQHQDGRTVTSFPLPFDVATGTPGSSSRIDYAQIGAEYTLGPVTARYNVSLGSYNNIPLPGGGSVTHKEWLHVPALGVAVSPQVYVLGELVFWQHDTPTASTLVDRSFNLTLNAHL